MLESKFGSCSCEIEIGGFSSSCCDRSLVKVVISSFRNNFCLSRRQMVKDHETSGICRGNNVY